jgi:hypothetical protein
MRQLLFFFFLVLAFPAVAQDSLAVIAQKKETPDFAALDSLYREDQFYIGFTYNILQNRPEDVRQSKFSSGYSFGFLRDMPINKARTWAIAAGLGFSIANVNHNIYITDYNGDYQYSVIPSDVAYDKSKLILNYADLPIEIRWRTSTPNTHKFWRVYTGIKFSYLVFSKYKFKNGDDKFSVNNNSDIDKFQYGMYLATGFNTWNLNIYYGFNPIFKSAELDGESIDMRTLNVGLMFYIL